MSDAELPPPAKKAKKNTENSGLRKDLDAGNALVSLSFFKRLEHLAPVFNVQEIEDFARKYAFIVPVKTEFAASQFEAVCRKRKDMIEIAIFQAWHEYLELDKSLLTVKEFVIARWPKAESAPLDSVVQFYFNRVLKKQQQQLQARLLISEITELFCPLSE